MHALRGFVGGYDYVPHLPARKRRDCVGVGQHPARQHALGYCRCELNDSAASVLGYAREGTIYPILYRLQEAELIQCRLAPATANGGSKKYYSLTDKGRGVLDELIQFWSDYENCVNSFISGYRQSEVQR